MSHKHIRKMDKVVFAEGQIKYLSPPVPVLAYVGDEEMQLTGCE
jgi:hypothetical protein